MGRYLLPVALAALLLVAGCSGTSGGPSTTDGVDVCGTPIDATDVYLTSIPPEQRLVLRAADDLEVTVTEYANEVLDNQTARETYELSDGETVRVDEFCVDGWITLTIDGETAWTGVIGSANHIEFELTADGNATITESYVS